MRRIAILDAPSNLGLRPPTVTSVPGCAKAPGALRDHGLLARLHARDAGCLTAPRYDPGDWRPGDGVCHAAEIATYSRRLADRIGAIIDAGEFPVVLGGDCSILLGSGLAMNRLGEAVGGRIGLVFVDGHSDFRHPGNAAYVGAAAGEDLALVTGRGQADLASIEGRRPYFRDVDVVVMGIRAQDEYRLDLQAAGIVTRPVPTLRGEGAARSAQWARDQLVDCAGYWVHVDVDVLDPAVMPAVDAPDPGGIAFPELELLLAGLVDTPHCLGVEITVFDPDYDPDGTYAEEIAGAIVSGLTPARTVVARPDLVAARRDLAAARTGESGARRRPPAARASEPAPAARVTEPAVEKSADGDSEIRQPDISDLSDQGVEDDGDLGEIGTDETTPEVEDAQAASALDDADTAAAGTEPEAVEVDSAGAERQSVEGNSADVEPRAVGADFAAAGAELAAAEFAAAEFAAAEFADAELADAELADAELADAELADAELADAELADADFADADFADADFADAELADAEFAGAGAEAVEVDPDGAEPEAVEGDTATESVTTPGIPAQPVGRPLGSAPLLDSEPLPATRPGMLRPRTAEGFSLPAQRPAFDIGPGAPADIA